MNELNCAMALAAALLVSGGAAVAQDVGDDWDYGENAAQKLSIAAVSFENFGVAVRCMDGSLSVLMAGLPADSGRRTLNYQVGEGPEHASNWISSPGGTTAFAFWPRAVARDLSEGGRLAVVVSTADGPRRITVDIPRSREAVARVFRNCDRELASSEAVTAPRDENFVGLEWIRQPDGSFPDRARFADGIAAVQCRVRASGRLGDCAAESEFPEGSGFGRAAVLAAHRTGRVGPAGGGDAEIGGRAITFTMRYGLIDNYMTPPPSRLPERGKAYNDLPPEDDD